MQTARDDLSYRSGTEHVTATGIMGTGWSTYLVALGLGFGVVLAYESLFEGVQLPYSSDSAVYIEQARNLNSGIGLYYSTPYGPYPVDTDLERVPVFPPGYALAIALGSRLGFAEDTIAPWLSRLAAALLPAAMVFGFAAMFGAARIVTVGLLVILSPGVLIYQYLALSDAIFLLLAVLSIGLLVRSPHCGRALLVSGALAGLAYCFRNVGIALLVSVPTSMVASGLLRLGPGRVDLTRVLIWASGAAIFVLPLVAFNIAIFGAAQPYGMPPSTVGLLTNAGMFLGAQVADVLGLRLLGRWPLPDSRSLVLPPVAVLGLLLVAVLGFVLVTAQAWRRPAQQEKTVVIVLGCYALAGAGVVILARTRYQWGEMISGRHAMQYSWAIVILLAVAVNALMRGMSSKRRALVMAAAISALVTLRIADVYGWRTRVSDSVKQTRKLSENQALMSQVAAIPSEAMICSNVALLFRIKLARSVRRVNVNSLDDASLQTVRRLAMDITPHRPVYFVLVPPAVARTQQTVPERAAEWLTSVGAENIVRRQDFVVIKVAKLP
jgi:hypothetical protein